MRVRFQQRIVSYMLDTLRLDISALDPADEATVEAVQKLRVTAGASDVPDFPPPCPRDFRAELTFQTSSRRTERFIARMDGRVAGYLVMSLPLRDNLENVEIDLHVDPAFRRRGVGRALHAHAVGRTLDLGRRRLSGASVAELPGGQHRGIAGRRFAEAMNAKPALDEVRRRLDFATADEGALVVMLAEARSRADGYQVVSWRDRTPDEYAADTGYLEGRLNSDAPIGDLALEPEVVDTQRLREREQLYRLAGIRVYSTGVVHKPSGRLVALTTLARMATVPWHAWQWITLVDPAHRGHRLGALVKIENLRFARGHESALRVVDTWNAAVNSHMISINEAMGFRPVDSWIMWQQEV
jgi:GNAT superfamily N-acetyltransferase